MPARREAHESDAEERLRREVERAPPLLGGEARDLRSPRRLRKAGEVDERQRPARGGGDDGLRRAAGRGEGGAQDLVPADHLVERAGEEGGESGPEMSTVWKRLQVAAPGSIWSRSHIRS